MRRWWVLGVWWGLRLLAVIGSRLGRRLGRLWLGWGRGRGILVLGLIGVIGGLRRRCGLVLRIGVRRSSWFGVSICMRRRVRIWLLCRRLMRVVRRRRGRLLWRLVGLRRLRSRGCPRIWFMAMRLVILRLPGRRCWRSLLGMGRWW